MRRKEKKKIEMEEIDTASDLRALWSILNYDACEFQTLREERERQSVRERERKQPNSLSNSHCVLFQIAVRDS